MITLKQQKHQIMIMNINKNSKVTGRTNRIPANTRVIIMKTNFTKTHHQLRPKQFIQTTQSKQIKGF